MDFHNTITVWKWHHMAIGLKLSDSVQQYYKKIDKGKDKMFSWNEKTLINPNESNVYY